MPPVATLSRPIGAASRFYGYPEETLRSLGFHDLNQAEPLRLGQLLGSIRQGQLSSFQETHRLASGREREVEIQAGPVTTGDTELIYLIINDVTEREQSLKALRDNEPEAAEPGGGGHRGHRHAR